MCFCSLTISVLASVYVGIISTNNTWAILGLTIIFVVGFLATPLFKHGERGQMGLFKQYVDIYEKNKLEETIREFENKLVVSDDDIEMEKTRQYLLNALMDIFNNVKFDKKKKINWRSR